jgi:phosphoribosylglycinamide formyltransferase-1
MSELRVAVLASGRGTNLQALLDAEASGSLGKARIVLVLSDRAQAKALDRARERGVEALFLDPQPFAAREAYDEAVLNALRSREIGLVALAGFMRVLTPVLVRAFPNRILNIHPALLPAFPGLHAQRRALEQGVKVAGCTVHFVDEQVDHGPIILQAAVPVREDDTEETLSARILAEEHRIYPQAVRLFAEGKLAVAGRRVRIAP